MTDLEILIDGVRRLVPRVVDNFIPANYALDRGLGRCLPATRIGMEALRYFGIDAKPLPTFVIAGNLKWWDWHRENPDATVDEMPDGAWSVGIGRPDNPGPGVNVHVVLNIEDEILLDLDARQMSRPNNGMPVPETILAPLTEDFRAVWHEGDVAVSYMRHPSPPNWKVGGDWRYAGKHAGSVIRALKAAQEIRFE